MSKAESGKPLVSPRDLPRLIRARSEAARASGALVPLDSDARIVESDDIAWLIRVAANLARKDVATAPPTPRSDPFAPPYDHDLVVGYLSPTHVALLNKFNVLADHLLMVTRAPEEQTRLLDATDFAAMVITLAGIDGLAFYNGGPEAGASQRHKHLQIVPLPLAPDLDGIPLTPDAGRMVCENGVGRMPAWPFRHAIADMPPFASDDPVTAAPEVLHRYRTLWQALGHDVMGGGHQPVPYNLLATRKRIWLVPRSRERSGAVAVNALGYAGCFLVRDEAGYRELLDTGPMQVLAATGEVGGSC